MCFAKYVEKTGRTLDDMFQMAEARKMAVTVGQWGPQRMQGVIYEVVRIPFRPGHVMPQRTQAGECSIGYHGTTVNACWRIMAEGFFRRGHGTKAGQGNMAFTVWRVHCIKTGC